MDRHQEYNRKVLMMKEEIHRILIVELYVVNLRVEGLINEELALEWLGKLNVLEEAMSISKFFQKYLSLI